MKTYAFYDKKQRKPEEHEKLAKCFDLLGETNYLGIEELFVSEVPVDRQWQLLEALRDAGDQRKFGIPGTRPHAEAIREVMLRALKSSKGSGYSADLIELCANNELPRSITDFLAKVFADFPAPIRAAIATKAAAPSEASSAPSESRAAEPG